MREDDFKAGVNIAVSLVRHIAGQARGVWPRWEINRALLAGGEYVRERLRGGR
jgi:hypothetical protein